MCTSMLPEQLRPKPGLSPYQLRVYEDYARLTRRLDAAGAVAAGAAAAAAAAAGGNADALRAVLGDLGAGVKLDPVVSAAVAAASAGGGGGVGAGASAAAAGSMQAMVTVTLCLERFLQTVVEMERVQAVAPQDIAASVRTIGLLVASSAQREDATNLVAQRAIVALLEKPVDAVRELCVQTLERLAEAAPRRFAKDVALVVLRQFEEGKHVLPAAAAAAVALARRRLFSVTELVRVALRLFPHASAAGTAAGAATVPVEYVVRVVQTLLADDSADALRAIELDLPGALDTLTRVCHSFRR
jgi:hypothetical protein